MNIYDISTDSASMTDIEAENIAEALEIFGEGPKSARVSVEAFVAWIEKCGGYCSIDENGVEIAAAE